MAAQTGKEEKTPIHLRGPNIEMIKWAILPGYAPEAGRATKWQRGPDFESEAATSGRRFTPHRSSRRKNIVSESEKCSTLPPACIENTERTSGRE